MKSKLILLASILSVTLHTSIAQTNITTAAQSGTWTLNGSPYIIQTNINVPGGQSLTIEPGVHVQFQQTYQFDIAGSLITKGTATLPIYFQATDTTGWYNDMITTGGWHGVHFNQFQGTVDSSAFVNCIIQDVKHGVTGNWNGIEALFVNRTLKIDSCQLFHNQSSYNMAEGVTILIHGGGSFEMSHCTIHDNLNRVCALRIGTGTYEPINIHHCHFYNNSVGATIWMLQSNVLFEYNQVNNNTSIYDMSAIRITGFRATLRHNTIHHNLSESEAPITSFAGIVDIDANLICNNHHTSGNCGLVDGGGGIHVMQNDGSNWDSTRYILRNNIIANNYSPYYGGGIYVYNTIAKVMNNHIINNGAHYGGGGIFAMGPLTELHMQNNLFYGNCNDLAQAGTVSETHDIQLSAIHLITYRNNWVEYSFPWNVMGTATIVSGDTAHNVIGSDPHMINPTTTCSYLDSALNSDFNLQNNSSCIDAGDSTGSLHTPKDYAGNYRMMGTSIDIGAFEQPGEIINSSHVNVENEFNVYPNPVSGQLVVEKQHLSPNNFTLFVIDAFGRVVLHFEMTGSKTQLDVQSLANGIYLAELISANGIERVKILVQK